MAKKNEKDNDLSSGILSQGIYRWYRWYNVGFYRWIFFNVIEQICFNALMRSQQLTYVSSLHFVDNGFAANHLPLLAKILAISLKTFNMS